MKKISQFYNGKFTEMTSRDVEFNQIRLKIQIEVKMRERKTTFEGENLQNMKKISQFFKRKFTEFEFK